MAGFFFGKKSENYSGLRMKLQISYDQFFEIFYAISKNLVCISLFKYYN